MSRSRSNFLAQLERAQFIAFSPFIFQAAAAALRTGLLETLSRSPGQNVAGAAAASGLTPYAAGVLIDILATAGILEPAPNEGLRGWKTTPVGDLLIYDEMTRANFFFTADTCWPGLDRTEEALKEGKPAGLAAFNPSWKTSIRTCRNSLPWRSALGSGSTIITATEPTPLRSKPFANSGPLRRLHA